MVDSPISFYDQTFAASKQTCVFLWSTTYNSSSDSRSARNTMHTVKATLAMAALLVALAAQSVAGHEPNDDEPSYFGQLADGLIDPRTLPLMDVGDESSIEEGDGPSTDSSDMEAGQSVAGQGYAPSTDYSDMASHESKYAASTDGSDAAQSVAGHQANDNGLFYFGQGSQALPLIDMEDELSDEEDDPAMPDDSDTDAAQPVTGHEANDHGSFYFGQDDLIDLQALRLIDMEDEPSNEEDDPALADDSDTDTHHFTGEVNYMEEQDYNNNPPQISPTTTDQTDSSDADYDGLPDGEQEAVSNDPALTDDSDIDVYRLTGEVNCMEEQDYNNNRSQTRPTTTDQTDSNVADYDGVSDGEKEAVSGRASE